MAACACGSRRRTAAVYRAVAMVAAIAIGYLALVTVSRAMTDADGRWRAMDSTMSLLPGETVTGRPHQLWTAFGGPTELDVVLPPGADQAADLRERAVAAGWTAGPIGPGQSFTLDRPGQTLVVSVASGTAAGLDAYFDIRFPWPEGLLPAGAAALLSGGLIGWLLAAWTLRRFRSRVPAGRLLIALAGTSSLVLIGAAAVSAALAPRDVFGAATFTGSFAQQLGLLAAAATLLFAAILPAADPTAQGRPPTDLMRMGVRVVAAIHLAFGLAIATVLFTFTARMLAAGADRAAMLSGAHDPKEVLPFGVFLPVALLFYSGVILSPLLLTVSVPLLAVGRGRAGAVAWRLLLVAAISAVVLPALLFTPYGADASRWWLD